MVHQYASTLAYWCTGVGSVTLLRLAPYPLLAPAPRPPAPQLQPRPQRNLDAETGAVVATGAVAEAVAGGSPRDVAKAGAEAGEFFWSVVWSLDQDLPNRLGLGFPVAGGY